MKVILKIGVALFFSLISSFIITGYQALLPVLFRNHVYADLCSPNETNWNSNHHDFATSFSNFEMRSSSYPHPHSIAAECQKQQLRLDLMFTITTSLTNFAGILVAIGNHFFGEPWTIRIGCILTIIGSFLFGLSNPKLDLYIPGYGLMGIGGVLVGLPLLTLAKWVSDERKGLIISLFVGMIDGSAGMMFVFYFLSKELDWSIQEMFWGYCILPFLFFLTTFWIFHSPPIEESSSTTPSSQESNSHRVETKRETDPLLINNSKEERQMYNYTVFQAIQTREFFLITIWSSLYMTTKYYYITNINEQLLWITDGNETQTKWGVYAFSVLLPLSGIFSPVVSFIVDRFPSYMGVVSMIIVSIICAVSSVLPIYELQFVTITTVVFNRFFLFTLGPYILERMFPHTEFTSLIGVMDSISACFNLTGYFWSYLSIHVFHHNFFYTNVGLSAACVIYGVFFAVVVSKWQKRISGKT